jgi:hypothetical protein
MPTSNNPNNDNSDSPSTNPWTNHQQTQAMRHSLATTRTSRSMRRTQADARTFFPASPNQGFQYIYLNTNKRLPLKELRRKFRRLGITTSRLLDIHYPTRNVVAILIHNDYQQEFVAQLHTYGVQPIADFDPTDPRHLQNPEYTAEDVSDHEKELHAQRIINTRMIRTLEYLRPTVRNAVGKYFVDKGWITREDLQEVLALDQQQQQEQQEQLATEAASTFAATNMDISIIQHTDSDTPHQ